MQPFRRDLLAVDAGHVRTTPVAVADFLDGASERQVPKLNGRSLRKPPPAAMGRKLTFGALIQSNESSHHHDRVPLRTLLGI
ncbi:MAG TPA: hypothetical protein VNU48_09345 [Burkholderiaceae bacterium]|nr:hypothetical protein [Burkholderiaceae bacterium]